MAEALYWSVMAHLMNQTPSFAKGKVRRGYLRRFHKVIHALDSTTIQLVANCMDWAKHRRRKAAAKCHLRLNLQTFLPQCAIVDTAPDQAPFGRGFSRQRLGHEGKRPGAGHANGALQE